MAVQPNAELLPEIFANFASKGDIGGNTMSKLKLGCAAALLCGSFVATAASAMPVAPLSSAATSNVDVEQVRWVCGPYRCWWRPDFYRGYGAYGFYPRRHWGGWRYRGWHRW
jgi:hypothetical protein